MKHFLNLSMVLFLAICLWGCSTDDDPVKIPSEPQPEPVETLKGVFLDSPVEGLHYETETKSGTTNSNGEFSYLEGETVTFSVGDVLLGSALGEAEVTPVSIAVSANADHTTLEVKNIAAFLQTLDTDSDASNGITIAPEVAGAINLSEIDFTSPIITILGEMTADIFQTTGIVLQPVYPEAAAAHLAENLGETYESEEYVFRYFVPLIESLNSLQRSSFHWIHQTDESGKLIGSTAYEKIPYRRYEQFVYLEHNAQGQPTKFELTAFRQDFPVSSSTFNVFYGDDHKVTRLNFLREDGSIQNSRVFTSFDVESRLVGFNVLTNAGDFWLRNFRVLDDNGDVLTETVYNSPTDDNDINRHTTYEYGDNGQLKTLTSDFNNGTLRAIRQYFYRTDSTLERVENTDPNTVQVTFYDENENVSRITITQGDYRSDYTEFYPSGQQKRVETYHFDVLIEVVTFNEDGSSEWKIINEEDNTYRIEFKNPSGAIIKTEFYDAEGNLLSTVVS